MAGYRFDQIKFIMFQNVRSSNATDYRISSAHSVLKFLVERSRISENWVLKRTIWYGPYMSIWYGLYNKD